MTKRLLLVALLAIAVLAIGTSVAFAATTSGYTTWNSGTMSGNPHSDYQTTTVKCNVCHAVHKAPSTGQVLLRSTVGDSCTFCHIANNFGVKVLYGGTGSNLYTSADSDHAHNNYTGNIDPLDNNPVTCVECHTVHGAGALGVGGGAGIGSGANALYTKILKPLTPQATLQAMPAYALATGAGATRDTLETGFCSSCHPYFAGTYETVIGVGKASANQLTAYGANTFKGHVMTATIDSYHNKPPATTSATQVAWAGSETCRSCHDGGQINTASGGSNNFPHFTDSPRFLNSAPSLAGTEVTATLATEDGICLKCHKANSTTGVGSTY